jgi:hypothetical protein
MKGDKTGSSNTEAYHTLSITYQMLFEQPDGRDLRELKTKATTTTIRTILKTSSQAKHGISFHFLYFFCFPFVAFRSTNQCL